MSDKPLPLTVSKTQIISYRSALALGHKSESQHYDILFQQALCDMALKSLQPTPDDGRLERLEEAAAALKDGFDYIQTASFNTDNEDLIRVSERCEKALAALSTAQNGEKG